RFDQISAGVPGEPKEVWTVIARICVPFQGRGKRVKGGRGEALSIDIRERRGSSAISDPQQIQVVGMATKLRQKWNGVQPGTVVVNLPLDARELAAIEEVPISSGVAVVAPMRHGGVVCEDRIQGDERLVFKTEA